jgi:hypothetical protein
MKPGWMSQINSFLDVTRENHLVFCFSPQLLSSQSLPSTTMTFSASLVATLLLAATNNPTVSAEREYTEFIPDRHVFQGTAAQHPAEWRIIPAKSISQVSCRLGEDEPMRAQGCWWLLLVGGQPCLVIQA